MLTSTMSVYEGGGANITERAYNPFPGKYDLEKEHGYGEGKRQAESYFFQRATFPVVAVRFPVVLGPDDYTERLVFHIKRALDGRPIVAENTMRRWAISQVTKPLPFLSGVVVRK